MPKKRPEINKEDLDIFHQAMKGVKPLHTDKIHLTAPARKKPLQRQRDNQRESLNLDESLIIHPVQGEEFISFRRDGVSHKTLRNLRKGQYNIEATLDLHGMIIDQAKAAVDEFLQQCLHEQIRVVLIIHGKGHGSHMPVLKNKLNHWLRALPAVLAFCSAAPIHGSRGAIYVLLRKYV